MSDVAERYRRHGTDEWRQRGSAVEHHRYSQPIDPKSRRRCSCGCNRRSTHLGMANGIALMDGCELAIARWVKNPFARRTHLESKNG